MQRLKCKGYRFVCILTKVHKVVKVNPSSMTSSDRLILEKQRLCAGAVAQNSFFIYSPRRKYFATSIHISRGMRKHFQKAHFTILQVTFATDFISRDLNIPYQR